MKNVPMSAQKMREVVRQIQGLPALQAVVWTAGTELFGVISIAISNQIGFFCRTGMVRRNMVSCLKRGG
jgi:hypothetical protein